MTPRQTDEQLIASIRERVTGLDKHGYNRSLIEEHAMLLCDRLEAALAALRGVYLVARESHSESVWAEMEEAKVARRILGIEP